ncbi:hypothetical protein [Brachyspira aalborgi]|jgi:hypothetical protein|uniref:Uncharacterized protein n=1 Tax=Brachyspira aalborgi TaxID=29522 RepID=A0ABY3K6M8_9SPIR|nr:hypothetical protein [Brachyspira aalborgi]TXJ31144.1 hypothetical protein EPJ71_10445 [Brachyspira aalborgi]TXJ40034.1 hypothetical protein EPJ65_12385 [Brachyspira aalborgi]DAZ18876.1 MAG TPA: hypothetical protein [Caudoviricetes sp.]
MSIKTYNNILLYGSISILIFFILSLITGLLGLFIIFGFWGVLYLIFIAVKRHQAIEEENNRLDLEIKINMLNREEEELESINENIDINKPEIDNNYMPIKKQDDKIRFYTEEDYNTTDITKIFYDVDGSGGVLVGNMRERVKQDLNSINKFIREAQDMRIPVKPFFNIDIDKVIFDLPNENQDQIMSYTHFIKENLTKTGKTPKYPYRLFFRTVEYAWIESDGIISTKKYDTIHGNLYYLENQTIGKAWFVMWKQHNSYKIELKLIDNILSLGKIEYSTPNHQYYETLYKSEDKK